MVSKSNQAVLNETIDDVATNDEKIISVQSEIAATQSVVTDYNELYISEEKMFSDEKVDFDPADVADDATLDFDDAVDPLEQAMKTLDEMIFPHCKDNPKLLASQEFKDAYALVCEDEALKFEYRTKLKKAKPSAVLMSAFRYLEGESTSGDGDGNESIASELISLVTAQGKLFFDDHADKAYVTADIKGVEHTMSIGSKSFSDWLSFSYYSSTKGESEFGLSASENAMKQASFALSGIAKYEGVKQRAYLRTAQHNGIHYIFLANEKMQVVEVLSTGWKILDMSPVKFWKSAAMQDLPVPITGGDLNALWQFINVPVEDRPLVLAWLLEALRAESKKPVLGITGLQGTAKSSTHDKLKQLVDPNTVNLRAAPKNREDIFISAGCNWVVSFENISHFTPEMQDALCTLSTGGGFAARTLYTNSEETIISVQRPVIINSIPTVATAQDLTDRLIAIELQPIAYREDAELNLAWEEAKPAIFGGLMDLFVKALAKLPDVTLVNPPRMADFTRLGEAMMQAQGEEAGFFTDLYINNRSKSISKALESSPVAVAICAMVESHIGMSLTVYKDTMQNLLHKLSNEKLGGESFPKSARGLSDVLKRQSPALLTYGIEIIVSSSPERINGSRGTVIEIRKVANVENKIAVPTEKVYMDEERF